ncbi:hypothetical protein ACI2L4_37755 [Streptomyces sparsogenes]|uniref:Uncharacterized protein n=1 Tax=Streptomyces cuspidosporus TaxID=66882 RepID=A0ABN3H893_9ACTN
MGKPVEPGGSDPLSPFGKGMAKEAETLAKFKGRIDKILTDLQKSPASKQKLEQQTITRDAYGGSLDSASALYAAYNNVHGNLVILSQLLRDLLEGSGYSALIAEKGIDGIDAEQARRLQAIQAQALKHYRDPKTGLPVSGSQHGSDTVGSDAY